MKTAGLKSPQPLKSVPDFPVKKKILIISTEEKTHKDIEEIIEKMQNVIIGKCDPGVR